MKQRKIEIKFTVYIIFPFSPILIITSFLKEFISLVIINVSEKTIECSITDLKKNPFLESCISLISVSGGYWPNEPTYNTYFKPAMCKNYNL